MPDRPVAGSDASASTLPQPPIEGCERCRLINIHPDTLRAEVVTLRTEVARLRTALESIHIHQVAHIVNAALAEGSDVPNNDKITPFTPTNQCCHDNVPPLSNSRPNGETHQCPTCGRWWAWEDDEAKGGAWWPFDLAEGSDVLPTQRGH